jgi:hypothetical protein
MLNNTNQTRTKHKVLIYIFFLRSSHFCSFSYFPLVLVHFFNVLLQPLSSKGLEGWALVCRGATLLLERP